MHPDLATFIERMDELTAGTADTRQIADMTQRHLAELLGHPEFLEPVHRAPADDHYQQHLVHVHPEGRYSVVSLVWRAGQQTPVHDHRCWCVVGVLQGHETETRYHLYEHDGGSVLTTRGTAQYAPGDVCALVPPEENIHQVANAGFDDLTISMHIYGTDIAAVGSSINHVFDLPLVNSPPQGATQLAWRTTQ